MVLVECIILFYLIFLSISLAFSIPGSLPISLLPSIVRTPPLSHRARYSLITRSSNDLAISSTFCVESERRERAREQAARVCPNRSESADKPCAGPGHIELVNYMAFDGLRRGAGREAGKE